MKKLLIVLIAFLFMIAGASVCLGTFVAIDFNFYVLEGVDWVEKVYTVEGEFSSILLTLGSDDLTVLPSEDGTCRFVCQESEKYSHDVQIKDGALHITESDTFRWYDRFFSFTSPRATLYLPQSVYSLFIKIGSGDVEIPSKATFASLDIATGSGDVTLQSVSCDSLQITTGSGDIELNSVNAASVRLTCGSGDMGLKTMTTQSLSAKTGSGDVNLEGTTTQALSVQTASGDITLTLINCDEVDVKTGSGEVHAVRLICGGHLSMQSGSGDILLEFCDAATLSFLTGSGDVEGILLSPKTFRSTTGSGNESYPPTQGGLCEATTQSGDIEFSIHTP